LRSVADATESLRSGGDEAARGVLRGRAVSPLDCVEDEAVQFKHVGQPVITV